MKAMLAGSVRRRFLPSFLLAVALLLCQAAALAQKAPEVVVRGANDLLADNIKAALNVSTEDCKLSASRRRLLDRTLLETARNAARAVGYYEAAITLEFAREDECWKVLVRVTPGPPVKLVEVQVNIEGPGADNALLREVREENLPKTGRVLRHDRYQKLRDSLQEAAERLGFFDYELTRRQLLVDTDKREARIFLTLETGPRYRFGDVTLTQDILYDERVRSWLTLQPGEPWDSERLLASQQSLLGSGYFATARIERKPADMDTGRVPLTIHLTPRRKWAWLAGVGVSTDTGLRLRLGSENRYINRRGHRWQAQAEVSEVRSNVTTSYEIPLADPARERLIFAAGYENEVTDTVDTDLLRAGARLINELPSRWVLTRSLEFERESFEIADEHQTTELLMPGLQLQKIRGNHPIYPSRGWKLGTALQGTTPAISSTEQFVQSQVWAELILPFLRGRFLSRVLAGYTEVDDVEILPASVRFFAGGDNSVRGFAYQSLGAEDENGEVLGGRHTLVGSVELEYPLFGQWHVAVFTDAGNAFNDFGTMDIQRSAGAGLRWRSPLGPIRLDVARSLDENRSWRLHLSMGPDL